MRIDEPITTDTSRGRPLRFTTGEGHCYRVRRVMGEWQAPGEARLFRLQAIAPDGPTVVAEIISPANSRARWRLLQVWS